MSVRGIEQVAFQPGTHVAFLSRALAELAAGRITLVIGVRYPLEGAADAHAAIEARIAVGKWHLVVRLDSVV